MLNYEDTKVSSKEFVKKYKITVDSEWSNSNPFMKDSPHMNHYKSTLRIRDENGSRQFTLYYSKGMLLEGEPTAEEILECLVMDMNCTTDYTEEDFISSMGYEDNYRHGQKVYEQILKQTGKMYKFLGHKKFQEFKRIDEDG